MKYASCAVLTGVIGILWSYSEILMWLSSRGFAAFCASRLCQLGFAGWGVASFKQMASLQWLNWCLEVLTVCKINIQYEPDLVIAWLQLGGVQSHHFWMKFTIVHTSQFILSLDWFWGFWLMKHYDTEPIFDTHDLTNSYLPKFFFLHI